MDIIQIITENVKTVLQKNFATDIPDKQIKIEKTRKEFAGDFTLNVFPFLRFTKKSPEETAEIIGQELCKQVSDIEGFNVIRGFLNLVLSDKFWLNVLKNKDVDIIDAENEKIVLEFSSPNTNKPLHLGHLRNNLLGDSLARILKKTGKKVIKVNLVNDRGIHICKSMLAWQRWGNGITPESAGKKGDKLVGDFYVLFNEKFIEEVRILQAGGMSREAAERKSELMTAAREMLVKWEKGDKEVLSLWEKMNNWVYAGFNDTYGKLGIVFDKVYYESETYENGKSVVLDGLKKGIFYRKTDGSIWVDLTDDRLSDEKLLLRADGTSVYMTQDIGTYLIRHNEWQADKYMYVVGNEQEYHFNVLKRIVNKLGYDGKKIVHISYGMVNLPQGKMKSREGTVVDADDLIAEMLQQAKIKAGELGKLDELPEDEKQEIYRIVGFGALKYFLLKVDSKKNMLFDPEQSVDFEGNTAPFIQYTYARIRSLQRKAEQKGITPELKIDVYKINEYEREILKWLFDFPQVVLQASRKLNPSIIANYTYGLAKDFNKFYQENPILKNTATDIAAFRLLLSQKVGDTIKETLELLGIEVPERM